MAELQSKSSENSQIEKEYLVRVEGKLAPSDLALLCHGLSLDGVALRPAKVSWQNEHQLRFVLREGRKRQIRRMCELVGLHVTGLKRIRIGQISLGNLPLGQWRFLRPNEKFSAWSFIVFLNISTYRFCELSNLEELRTLLLEKCQKII
jgi:pseudouridine synthase